MSTEQSRNFQWDGAAAADRATAIRDAVGTQGFRQEAGGLLIASANFLTRYTPLGSMMA